MNTNLLVPEERLDVTPYAAYSVGYHLHSIDEWLGSYFTLLGPRIPGFELALKGTPSFDVLNTVLINVRTALTQLCTAGSEQVDPLSLVGIMETIRLFKETCENMALAFDDDPYVDLEFWIFDAYRHFDHIIELASHLIAAQSGLKCWFALGQEVGKTQCKADPNLLEYDSSALEDLRSLMTTMGLIQRFPLLNKAYKEIATDHAWAANPFQGTCIESRTNATTAILATPTSWERARRAARTRSEKIKCFHTKVCKALLTKGLFRKSSQREGEAPAEPRLRGQPARQEHRPPTLGPDSNQQQTLVLELTKDILVVFGRSLLIDKLSEDQVAVLWKLAESPNRPVPAYELLKVTGIGPTAKLPVALDLGRLKTIICRLRCNIMRPLIAEHREEIGGEPLYGENEGFIRVASTKRYGQGAYILTLDPQRVRVVLPKPVWLETLCANRKRAGDP